jgi:imidazole glycerol-phosphate synthase subunit HisH
MNKTIIVDFESGNLFSVHQACASMGLEPVISSSAEDLADAAGVILPGVGAFADAMKNLQNSGMTEALHLYIKSGRPFLGICLGLQLLLEESEEFGSSKGLGMIRGAVRKFQFSEQVKVPHVGWSALRKPEHADWNASYFSGLQPGDEMYFVHSFYAAPSDAKDVFATAEYGGKSFCAAIRKNNIFATQFHPEKSGKKGLKIIEAFAAEVKR